MIALFTLTVLVSATLLFLVQPMFARMVLPLLGGSPAVWNTALVFYQIALLAGYAYAHYVSAWLGIRRHTLLHAALILLALVSLPVAVPPGWLPPIQANPIPWVLALMTMGIGLPFFVVSTTGPLIQKWFASTSHPSAHDPYFLYAASNAGSMLGLLGYPLLLEPRLRLGQQSLLWTLGYGLLAVLVTACGWVARRGRGATAASAAAVNAAPVASPAASASPAADPPAMAPIAWPRRLRWVLLAFVPSSLMLGVTMHITTDIAAVPLLWVVPLAIYLLSFILVFASQPPLPHAAMIRALPLVLLPLLVVMQARALQPLLLIMGLHVLFLFVAAMVCHGELAKDRPPPTHLTEFYLWLAVGGALGGAFNALLAPLVFRSVAEYPITMVLACLLMPPRPPIRSAPRERVLDFVVPLVLGGIVGLLSIASGVDRGKVTAQSVLLLFAVLALPLFATSRRPLRFGLSLAAVILVSPGALQDRAHTLYAQRSFFGVSRVIRDGTGTLHQLVHGTTVHGMQRYRPRDCDLPMGYYHRGSPIADVFRVLDSTRTDPRTVAVAGLGAGSLAPYCRPGDRWTFYEIDPVVERIARDTSYFCYLGACRGDARIVLGDARRSIAETKEHYDVMVLDAYSSDAIPVHLITREALRLYVDHLAPHGIVAFHLSNRFFDLKPIVASLAADAGLVCRIRSDVGKLTDRDIAEGKAPSTYAVLARSAADLDALAARPGWLTPLASNDPTWTDDFSSLLAVLRRPVH